MKRTGHVLNVFFNVASSKFPMWLLVLMELVVIVEVISRYIFRAPLGIADTTAAAMLAIIVLMGLGYTWQQRAHIRLEFVTGRLSPRARTRLRLVTVTLGILFMLVLLKGSFSLVAYSIKIDARSPSWESVHMVWFQLSMVIGYLLALFAGVAELIETVKAISNDRRKQ